MCKLQIKNPTFFIILPHAQSTESGFYDSWFLLFLFTVLQYMECTESHSYRQVLPIA